MGTNEKTSSAGDIAGGVETAVGGRRAASIMMDDRSGSAAKPEFRDHDGSGVTAEIGQDKLEVRTRGGANDQTDEEDLEGDLEDGAEGGEGDGSEAGEEQESGSAEDLGDFDPANAESVSKYETAFLTAEGGPNMEALMAEYGRNEEKGEGQLNEGTYAFLQDRFGLTLDQIKDFEADRKARRDADALGFHNAVTEAAGGSAVADLVAWGRTVYTPAQLKKYNADVQSGDPEVAAAAVALLKQRYDKANPPRAGVRPRRDVTANAGRKPTGVEPFKTQAEYRAANREARNSGDQAQLDLVRKRLKASPFYKHSGA